MGYGGGGCERMSEHKPMSVEQLDEWELLCVYGGYVPDSFPECSDSEALDEHAALLMMIAEAKRLHAALEKSERENQDQWARGWLIATSTASEEGAQDRIVHRLLEEASVHTDEDLAEAFEDGEESVDFKRLVRFVGSTVKVPS